MVALQVRVAQASKYILEGNRGNCLAARFYKSLLLFLLAVKAWRITLSVA